VISAEVKYVPCPELSATTTTRSPKMLSSSAASGAGRPCSRASKPLKTRGRAVSLEAAASAKIDSTLSHVGATQGAIECAGSWVATPLKKG